MTKRIQVPHIRYCSKCVYPSASAVPLVFDDQGVCSGCRVHGQKKDIDWDERLAWLLELVGRASDHACKDIRSGYMSREEGIAMVRKYDHVKSSDLYYWLDYVGRTEEWFDRIADTFRSPRVWKQDGGRWHKQNIWESEPGWTEA